MQSCQLVICSSPQQTVFDVDSLCVLVMSSLQSSRHHEIFEN